MRTSHQKGYVFKLILGIIEGDDVGGDHRKVKRKLRTEPESERVRLTAPIAALKEYGKETTFFLLTFPSISELGKFLQDVYQLKDVELKSFIYSPGDHGVKVLAVASFTSSSGHKEFISMARLNKAEVRESKLEYGDIVISGFSLILEAAERDGIFFPKDLIGNFCRKAVETFGATGETLLYHVGYQAGIQAYRDYWSKIPNLKEKVVIDALLSNMRAQGLIEDYEIMRYEHEKNVMIRIEGSFETGGQLTTCHFTRGLISGIVASLWSKHVVSKEEPCQIIRKCCLIDIVTLG